MSLIFNKSFKIGNVNLDKQTIRFYQKDEVWKIGGKPIPQYHDVIIEGITALTLVNAKADGLNYLKLFGGTELVPETYLDTVTLGGGTVQRNLPAEYTQVEYLESSGTQYIDTGIVLKSETTITTVGQNVQSSVVAGPYSFWGFMGTGNNLPRWSWSIYQNRWLPDLNMTTQNPLSVDNNKHTFINTCYYKNNVLRYDSLLDGNRISINDVENPTTYTSNTLSAYLFARNNSNTAGNFLSCRIFSYEIVQDGIKVLSLIPCKRNSDNVLGMYDTVTGNFLTNAGTGSFTAGSATVPTPDTPMDIVCNNGVLKLSPNLFDKNLVPDVNEYVNRSTGNISVPTSGEFRHSDYITIKENTQYYVGIINSVASSAGLAFYDDTKTYLSGISLTQLASDNNIITSPNYTQYIRFSFRVDEGYNTNWQNTVYLVEGNQPLAEFMPYGQIYTDGTVEQVTDSLGNTASAEMLLSVGDYKDTQEVLSGSVTRNVGIKVLDGTENWKKVSAGGTQRFYMTLTDSAIITGRYNVPITHFHFDSSSNDVGVGFLANQILYLYQNPNWTEEQFKQWLADQYTNGTPVIVVYPTSSATTERVSGQFLSKSPVTQTAGSIDNLPIAITESSHTVPTPQQPLQINCNNGVLKYNANIIDNSITGQGTFVSPSSQATRIYKYFGKLQSGNYILSITGGFQFIVQYRDTDPPTAGMSYGNIGTWATSGTYALDNPDYFYGIAIRYPDNSDITPSDFNGTITLKPQFVYTDGTVETVEVTGNLVDFNETRINSSTWDDADKTKGFEVYADVYNKSVGDNMLTNANAFGVFVPCKQGESISLNFFDYTPYQTRSLYCEITADRKCNTTPQAYENASVITQKTFTLTKSDSIGFIFEWYINAQQTRNYTKENYTVIKGKTPPTSYIPYFNGGSATAEMLLKVGDYKDVQSVLDGNVTRNVGIKVLDGTESWSYYSVTQGNMFRTKIAESVSGAKDTLGVLCNAYTVTPTSSRADNTLSGAAENFDFINNDYTTLNDWKAYLAQQYNAGTPVIVVYPLAESTTETVTGQSLTTQAGTNIASITQASIENLELEVSYKAGVAVTITEVQNAQLSNSVEVTIL